MGELNSANADLSEGEIWTESLRGNGPVNFFSICLESSLAFATDLLFRSCE